MSGSGKTIVVFGATGHQGGSTARALLGAGYTVVGITRDPTSPKAKSAESHGVKLYKGDLNFPETYAPALQGAYGVFLNIDFWALFDGVDPLAAKAKEEAQGLAAVTAIKAAGVKHLVYSTLDSLGDVAHFDSKATIAGYVRESGVPYTLLYTSYYYSNILFNMLKEEDGALILDMGVPDEVIVPSFAVEQTGLWAVQAFKPEWVGKDMDVVGECMAISAIATGVSLVTGRKCETRHVTMAEFEADTKTDRGWHNNFKAMIDKRFSRSESESRKVVPDAWTFIQWAKMTGALDKYRK
ncbi:hypothetical protein CspeluHIS016_0300970 [Cutaneotrichosporon spelunceum]|uniref:NmrA-like domain-containing protein n=1 Tax=Cutaneotrichosporon spelunceum TaxID=1672016 RepID=A0AAD3YBT9_9TREE|nr:hypothetical protein CspeluHIS016_0300970 [Cutaneotrichosporon spelunceum]